MKTKNALLTKFAAALLFLVLFMGFQEKPFAQATTTPPPDPGITVYQYRKVADNKRDEFIKRETTYWAEIAKKALAKGNLTFWALLEKVGGYDLENSSNFLFINTYKDVDGAGDVWNPSAAFPNITIDKMETNSISKTTSQFFLRAQGWEQAPGAVPEKDFKFVKFNYINSSNPGSLIELEKKHWSPFIKSAMEKKQTTQVAWGNATVLSPSGDNIHFNTVSYDLYTNLKEALNPTWDEKTVFPTDGLTEINKLELNRRGTIVYRVVKAISPN